MFQKLPQATKPNLMRRCGVKRILNQSSHCNQGGATLIEVIFAEALIGIVVVALLVALGNSFNLTYISGKMPRDAGTYYFTVSVSDSAGASGSQQITLTGT